MRNSHATRIRKEIRKSFMGDYLHISKAAARGFVIVVFVIQILSLFGSMLYGAEKYFVNVRLLCGIRVEGIEAIDSEIFLSTEKAPSLNSLRDLGGKTTENIQQILYETLLDNMDLTSIGELWSLSKIITDDEYGITETIADLSNVRKYRIHVLVSEGTSDAAIFQLKIFGTHEIERAGEKPSRLELLTMNQEAEDESRMEIIIDKKIRLRIGEPVIIGMPSGKNIYYVYIFPKMDNIPKGSKAEEKKEVVNTGMKPKSQTVPAYPAELRHAGYGGDVVLDVYVDEEGNVEAARILKSIHPYLDNAAVQALLRWTYDPFIKDGKPVAVHFQVTVKFDPEAGDREEQKLKTTSGKQLYSEPLNSILSEGARYCQKMKNAILYFLCEESIRETHYYFTEFKWGVIAYRDGAGSHSMGVGILDNDPQKTIRKKYLCDYQLIQRDGRTEERRIILKDDGRAPQDPKTLLNEKRYRILAPLFASIRILDPEHQWQYSYRMLDEKRINGENAYVIEALPINGNADGVEYGKIWLDQDDYSILKCEIQGIPLEGYEDILSESSNLNIKPVFTATYEYGIENKGIHFPSKSNVNAKYSYLLEGRLQTPTKLYVDFKYENYKYFTVETKEEIKK